MKNQRITKSIGQIKSFSCLVDACNLSNVAVKLAFTICKTILNSFCLESLEEAETKYSNEVILHSSDIQSLTSAKKELSEVVEQTTKLKTERDDAVEALKLKSSSWDEKEKKANEELKLLNQRLIDLDEQNQVLHENIQALGNQVAILQCRVSKNLFIIE